MKNKNKEDKTLKGKSKQPFGEGFIEDLEIKQILFFTTIIIQFILILNLYGKIEDLSIHTHDYDYAEDGHSHYDYAEDGHSHSDYAEDGHSHNYNYAEKYHTHNSDEVYFSTNRGLSRESLKEVIEELQNDINYQPPKGVKNEIKFPTTDYENAKIKWELEMKKNEIILDMLNNND